jgi:hypothetical protein
MISGGIQHNEIAAHALGGDSPCPHIPFGVCPRCADDEFDPPAPRMVLKAVNIPLIIAPNPYMTPGMQQASALVNALVIEQATVRLLIDEVFPEIPGATLPELVEAFVEDYRAIKDKLVSLRGAA